MAHGDKKWIKDFSGKWKKSNDRTKKDYYAGLSGWDDWRRDQNKENFCPSVSITQSLLKQSKTASQQ